MPRTADHPPAYDAADPAPLPADRGLAESERGFLMDVLRVLLGGLNRPTLARLFPDAAASAPVAAGPRPGARTPTGDAVTLPACLLPDRTFCDRAVLTALIVALLALATR